MTIQTLCMTDTRNSTKTLTGSFLLKHDSPRIRLIQASYANEDQKEEYRSWGLPYDPYVDPYLED